MNPRFPADADSGPRRRMIQEQLARIISQVGFGQRSGSGKMGTRTPIHPDGGAKPGGHYSPGMLAEGRFVYVSGQIPTVPETGEVLMEDVAAATRQTLENVRRILEAAGSSLAHVVKCNVYLRNFDDFDKMNAVYAEFFPKDPPTRTTVGCQIKVPVEIDCVALVPDP